MTLHLFSFIFSVLFLISCSSNNESNDDSSTDKTNVSNEEIIASTINTEAIDEAKKTRTLNGRIYHSEIVGWTIIVPKGWNIASLKESKAATNEGMDILEGYLETDIDISGLRELLTFNKSDFNDFASTAEGYSEATDGNYAKHNKKLYTIMYDAMLEQGLTMDTTISRTTIDGLNFELFHIAILHPESEEEMVQMQLYSRLINGFDFGVTITSDNPSDRKEATDALMNSKFEIQE